MVNRLLTTDEVAAYLRVDRNTVYRWCRTGHMPATKVGKSWRITESNLDHFVSRGGLKTAPLSLGDAFSTKLGATEHLLALAPTPEDVWELETAFFKIALDRNLPIYKGCWWQHPDDVRQRYSVAGLPVQQLEANGQLVIQNFWEAYKQGGAQAVVQRWQERGEQTKPSVFWASGSHLPNEWGGDPSGLIELESLLQKASSKLNTVAICPCVLTPSPGTHLTESFKLAPLHTGTLLMLGEGDVALLRPA